MDQIPQLPNTPQDLLANLAELLHKARTRSRYYWRKLVPPITRERRAEVQVQLRDSSKPDFDYFVLVTLSCAIATLGLLIDSAATIIGAMLVAPLMSPILGIGLASLRGDTKLLRDAGAALIRGALIAIIFSTIITWINSQLPFVALLELPTEVQARTQPSPIDLGVALAGGLAAAFALAQPQLSAALPGVAIATALMPPLCTVGIGIALGEWDVAGGAFLLFLTNAVTIAAASIFLFFALGFRLPRRQGEGWLPRSVVVSALLSAVLLIPLGLQSYQFVTQATRTQEINHVVGTQVAEIGAELVGNPRWVEQRGTLNMQINVRVTRADALEYEQTQQLHTAIQVALQQPVELQVNKSVVARLDPRVPPTFTPTSTQGPTATATATAVPPTPTATFTPTATATPTATPTFTPTFTATPSIALLDRPYGAGAYLREFPGGPEIAFLPRGSRITVLYGEQILDGWVWIEVLDQEGRHGWLPQFYTSLITLTPTKTPPALTPSPTPAP